MDFHPFEIPNLLQPSTHPIPDAPLGLQLKVMLQHSEPEIWRRIQVPGNLTLDAFHLVLQGAMGWKNQHLHQFSKSRDQHPFITETVFEEEGFGFREVDFRVDQLLAEVGEQLIYDYDFGDGWEHLLVVEKVLDAVPEQPRCIAGKRACPPEDMGGPAVLEVVVPWVESGFARELEPEYFDADDYLLWLGNWDPAVFDVEAATRKLQQMVRKNPERIAPQLRNIFTEIPPFRGEKLAELLDLDLWYEPVPPESALAPENLQVFTQLVAVVEGGVKLTAANYLPVAVVRDYINRTGMVTWLQPKISSESATPLVEIRELARLLGLLRMAHGVISPTKKALALGENPHRWEKQLREKLPLGKALFEQHAGWVALVVVGSGAPLARWSALIVEVLTDMGWAVQGHQGGASTIDYLGYTFELLEYLTHDTAVGLGQEEKVSEARVAAVAEFARRMVVQVN